MVCLVLLFLILDKIFKFCQTFIVLRIFENDVSISHQNARHRLHQSLILRNCLHTLHFKFLFLETAALIKPNKDVVCVSGRPY